MLPVHHCANEDTYDSAEKSKDISNYSVSLQIDLHSISKSSISQTTYMPVYPAYPPAPRQRKHDELHHSDNQHVQLQEPDLLILTKPIILPFETHSISCSKSLTTQSSKQLLHPDWTDITTHNIANYGTTASAQTHAQTLWKGGPLQRLIQHSCKH